MERSLKAAISAGVKESLASGCDVREGDTDLGGICGSGFGG